MIQNKRRQQAEKEKQHNILNQEANQTKIKRKKPEREMKKQEGRKKENNKRETKKEKKGGGPNKAKEKQRETQINKQKLLFLGEKTGLSY